MVQVLVTAGPTHEHLDDIRFLANASSGRTGFAIAQAAGEAGCRVVLIAGPVDLPTPQVSEGASGSIERIDVVSARDMHEAATARWPDSRLAFGVAAVADLRPKHRVVGKPAKEDTSLTLELERNPDVIAALGGSRRPEQVVVGFALEAMRLGADGAPEPEDFSGAEARARRKIERKGLDLCVLNGPSALGGGRSTTWLVPSAGAPVEPLGDLPKDDFARRLVDRALDLVRAREGAA